MINSGFPLKKSSVKYFKEVHKMSYLCVHTLMKLIKDMMKVKPSSLDVSVVIGKEFIKMFKQSYELLHGLEETKISPP